MFCAAQAPCGRAVKQEQGKGEAWPLDEVQAGLERGKGFSIFDFPVASSSSTDSLASKFSFLLYF